MYPFAWLGILADAPPVCEELIYSNTERGFALFSQRSPTVQRYYLQCRPDEDINEWPDERIWYELQTRLEGDDAPQLIEGPITQKGVTRDAQLRCRADAVRPAVPRRRFRAHRAADRREGHEPRDRRRGACSRAA